MGQPFVTLTHLHEIILQGIALDKTIFIIMIVFFLILHKNICCWYSLEAPPRGASNEYTQHMFRGEIRKNIYPDIPITCI